MKPIQLNNIIQTSVRMAESAYSGMSFRTELDPAVPFIDGDIEQIKRVLNNGAEAD
jgi:hypothetical protein